LLNIKTILLCSLVSFCSLLLFISSASAQTPCTPVVYAFRHAEDFDSMVALTRDGVEHANFYPNMVSAFQVTHNYCPVGFVYSMYNINADKKPGTTNPFQTAEPLAYAETLSKPLMHLSNNHYLYECFGKKCNTETSLTIEGNPTATPGELLAELKENASGPFPFSSAIFWTSEGLHTLGEAIASGTDIPVKGDHTPPRNAVYVFEYSGSTFNVVDGTQFLQRYLQCYNIMPNGDVSSMYYCKPGSAPTIADVTQLQAKICDTTTLGTQETNGFFPTPCQ